MKQVFLFFFSLFAGACFGQLSKPFAVNATANFNFATKGLGANDAGLGFSLEGLFFAERKAGVLLETGVERFMGDKLLVMDPATGEKAGPAVVCSVKAGPQIFVAPHVALAVTYGPVWHRVHHFNYTLNGGFRASFTGFMGKEKRFVTKLFLTNIPTAETAIRYAGVAAGYRF